jgi:hypothetical protein
LCGSAGDRTEREENKQCLVATNTCHHLADAEDIGFSLPELKSLALHPESSRGTSGSADHQVGILEQAQKSD